jgi:hypothetical protein
MRYRDKIYNQGLFEFKFKRKPRLRSIDEIHELYLRAKERSDERWRLKLELQNLIVKEIPKNDNNEIIVYFNNQRDPKNLYQFTMRYNSDWKGYELSRNRVEFSKDIVAARSEKIHFILNNEKAFELGQKYYELHNMNSYLDHKVMSILWEIVENKLREHYKKLEENPNRDVFIIKMGSKKYFVQVDEQHRFGYLKFHLKGEYCPDVLEIE